MRGEKIAADSRFYEPQLRGEFVAKARPYLHAGMDISDGLFCDTNKLLDMNDLGMEILENINEDIGLSGEEYEMLVAFDEEDLERVEQIAKASGTTLNVFAKAIENDRRFPCKSHHFS